MFTIVDLVMLVHFLQHLILHLIDLDSPFGLIVAGDAFQHKLDAIFSKIDFCTCVADNMIILGEQPDGSNHYKYLTEFLQFTRKKI